MTKMPEPQKVQKTIVQLQEVCQQFDALNLPTRVFRPSALMRN
jgi:hypothetical protein